MTDHPAALKAATEEYRKEVDRAAELRKQANEVQKAASDVLATHIRAAFVDPERPMRKADIIRAIDHEWSRTWVDRACRGDEPIPAT